MYPRRGIQWFGIARITTQVHNLSWGRGSACSGTDSPSNCFLAVQQCFDGEGISFCPKHIVNAELDSLKRKFSKEAAPPQQLFPCKTDISRPKASNEMTTY